MLGFLALAFARHPGLASVGAIGLVGFSVNLVSCLILVPACLAVSASSRDTSSFLDRISEWIATVGRAGYIPRGGGSIGALCALPIAWLCSPLPLAARVGVALGVSAAALFFVRHYMRADETADPQEIVADELAGCLVALAFVPFEIGWLAAAYVAFRILDIAKPWPIRWVERKLHGPVGVVADDVAAGLAAGAALAIARAWFV
jgi:phosphatidylglycerophosphatase A